MDKLILMGWSVEQWSTVNGHCGHLLRTFSDFSAAKCEWCSKNTFEPGESEVDPSIEAHMMMMLPNMGFKPIDSNTQSLDAAHKKATTQPTSSRSSGYSWLNSCELGGVFDC